MDHAVILDATNATDESINYLCKDAGKVLFKGNNPKILLSGGFITDLWNACFQFHCQVLAHSLSCSAMLGPKLNYVCVPFLNGWVFPCSAFGKTVFSWFGWSTFSTGLNRGWNSWKNICMIWACVSTISRTNQKWLEKCSVDKHRHYQPKPAAVEMDDPKRIWPKFP